MANVVANGSNVSQKSRAQMVSGCILVLVLLPLWACTSAPAQTAPPDPMWGFYDAGLAGRLYEAYDRVDPQEFQRLREQIVQSCDIEKAHRGLFLGQPNYTINGLEEEKNPGTVCNWNAARELIFFGRFSPDRQLLIGSRWFLKEHLRSITVYFPSMHSTVFRAWSITRDSNGWGRHLVHVDIRRPERTLRYLFNRIDGGLLQRYEFTGQEPAIQYEGVFFTSALRRGEANCVRYGASGPAETLSGAACKLPDNPDPRLTRLFPP